MGNHTLEGLPLKGGRFKGNTVQYYQNRPSLY